MTYEELLRMHDEPVAEIDMSAIPCLKGLYYNGTIGIDKNIETDKERPAS